MCETYSGGNLCQPHLGGKRVYMSSAGAQTKRAQIVAMANSGMSQAFLTATCQRYILPALCNYYFPPCDVNAPKPTPRKFCQDDCLLLQNDLCKREFALIARLGYGFYLPDCADMAKAATPAYTTCIRVVTTTGKTGGVDLSQTCVSALC